MRYYRRLAYRLRRQKLPDSEVARILSEVRDLATASATAPREQFGPAEAYAETFPEGRVRWPARRWVSWGARLAAIGFVIFNAELRRQGGQPLLPWWAVLLVWAAVLVAGEVAGHVLDHRLPRTFVRGLVPEATAEGAPRAAEAPGTEPLGYYRTLAFNLRLRHLPEREVARILADVRELSQASGAAPRAEFGPAQDYADQFERRKQRYGLSLAVFLACLLVVLVIQVVNMAADLRGADRLLPPGPAVLTYVALVLGGATFAVLWEHRLPRAFQRGR